MPPADKQRILIVEDDLDLAEMLSAYFNMQGYQAAAVAWGQEAIDRARDFLPDLIVLDIRLPDIDGFEVRTRLYESHLTRHVPVLFLTEKNDRMDKLHGLEMGVVDYITKPFDIQELRLRVRNVMRRAAAASLENAITGLPEGPAVDETLEAFIAGQHPDHGLLIIALRGLDAFRELYGFVAADDVLRVTSLTIRTAAGEIGGEGSFCGHLDDHTLVALVHDNRINRLQARVEERIGETLEYFYPADNRGPHAFTPDRLRLLMGQISRADGPFKDADDLKHRALQLKQGVHA